MILIEQDLPGANSEHFAKCLNLPPMDYLQFGISPLSLESQ
ncbi:hypothetical protein GGQ73_001222 [Rhizobium skierniewicense]|uniref:Uncharacterized protein n=1 Tax=Rhizobium skierniewicense TaxID=984260 RepID=A0A7W6G1A7_9HYPH|nr:hypothetical protein [Rhizobium skierniewicense]